MAGSRAFASLSATLLARKGGARPALRSPQAPGGTPTPEQAANDPLDAADDASGPGEPIAATQHAAEIVVLEPAAPVETLLARKPMTAEVVQLVREPAPHRAVALTARLTRPVIRRTRPAAFTLRIDPDRHFRLRLACALKARSAQSLITEALDRLLAECPEIEPLAEQVDQQRIA